MPTFRTPHQLLRSLFYSTFLTPCLTNCTLKTQQSKIAHDTDVYFSSVTAAPDWSSYSVIFAKSDSEDILGSSTRKFADITANSKFTALPKDAQSYFVGEKNGEKSIINKDLSGDTPKPTSVATSMATGTTTSTATDTGTSTARSTGGTAPKPTGAVMAAGAAAAGLLGIVAML